MFTKHDVAESSYTAEVNVKQVSHHGVLLSFEAHAAHFSAEAVRAEARTGWTEDDRFLEPQPRAPRPGSQKESARIAR